MIPSPRRLFLPIWKSFNAEVGDTAFIMPVPGIKESLVLYWGAWNAAVMVVCLMINLLQLFTETIVMMEEYIIKEEVESY